MEQLYKQEERVILSLRKLYRSHGYSQFKMSKFEPYDLYAGNKDFLVSERVITFNDSDGTLLALKPDVTLSIVKNYRHAPGGVHKVYYNENVYRSGAGTQGYREIMQTGLECMGEIDIVALTEVLTLALQSLSAISDRYVLDLSHMGLVSELWDRLPLSKSDCSALLQCLEQKNEDAARELCTTLSPELTEQVMTLLRVSGPLETALTQLSPFEGSPALSELRTIASTLRSIGFLDHVHLDFSIISDRNYYNGIVFRGYVEGLPSGILSGGQYDLLMKKMGKQAGGVGFAVYLDQLEQLNKREREYDVDTVLLYEDCDPSSLLQSARELRKQVPSLLVVRQMPADLRCRSVLMYRNGRIDTLENNG